MKIIFKETMLDLIQLRKTRTHLVAYRREKILIWFIIAPSRMKEIIQYDEQGKKIMPAYKKAMLGYNDGFFVHKLVSKISCFNIPEH